MIKNSTHGIFSVIIACGVLIAISLSFAAKLNAQNGSDQLLAEEDLFGNGERQCSLRTHDLSFLMTYRAPDTVGYGPRANHFDIIYASPQIVNSKLSLQIATSDDDSITAENTTKPFGTKMQAFFGAEDAEETAGLLKDMVKMSFVQSLGGKTIQELTFDFSSRQGRSEKEKFLNCIAQVRQPDNRGTNSGQAYQQCVASCETALNQSIPQCPAPNYDYSYEDPNAPHVGNRYINSPHEEHIQCLQLAERILIQLEPAFQQCVARCQEYLE